VKLQLNQVWLLLLIHVTAHVVYSVQITGILAVMTLAVQHARPPHVLPWVHIGHLPPVLEQGVAQQQRNVIMSTRVGTISRILTEIVTNIVQAVVVHPPPVQEPRIP
jgi:hypothetical protein